MLEKLLLLCLICCLISCNGLIAQDNIIRIKKKGEKIGELRDKRDGEIYFTITIGEQVWMAENLRYNATGSFSNQNNSNLEDGRIYNWATVMNKVGVGSKTSNGRQGICPNGWHVPSDEDWKTLEKVLGMSQSSLDSTGLRGTIEGSILQSPNYFNVFPTLRYEDGFFVYSGRANFWTSTDYSPTYAWNRYFVDGKVRIGRKLIKKDNGFSCRCIKD